MRNRDEKRRRGEEGYKSEKGEEEESLEGKKERFAVEIKRRMMTRT